MFAADCTEGIKLEQQMSRHAAMIPIQALFSSRDGLTPRKDLLPEPASVRIRPKRRAQSYLRDEQKLSRSACALVLAAEWR